MVPAVARRIVTPAESQQYAAYVKGAPGKLLSLAT